MEKTALIKTGAHERNRHMTGKTIEVTYDDKTLLICNQRCREWTHPYAYEGDGEDLHDAGSVSYTHLDVYKRQK